MTELLFHRATHESHTFCIFADRREQLGGRNRPPPVRPTRCRSRALRPLPQGARYVAGSRRAPVSTGRALALLRFRRVNRFRISRRTEGRRVWSCRAVDACHRAALLSRSPRPLALGLARRVVAPALDPPATGRGERRAARQLGVGGGTRDAHRTARRPGPQTDCEPQPEVHRAINKK